MTQHKPTINKHIIHVEDKIFYGRIEGAEEAIKILRKVVTTLRGFPQVEIMQKWDGCPSVFIGNDPTDGCFFVSTKSILNKCGAKVYKSVAELRQHFNGDLLFKLETCFEKFEPLKHKLPNIIQGDLLFTKADLIDMVPYITFQPNILIYKVGAHTDLGRAIEVADIGVIWHTTYHGNDLNNLTASYGVDLSPFLGRRDIWTIDPHITEQFNISFVKCDEILSIADEILGYINYNSMDRIVDTPLLADIIESVINDGIRKGVEHTPHQLVLNLIHKTAAIHKKEIEELKQKAAKKRALDRYIMISDAIRDIMGDLPAIFQLHDALTRAKLFLINILDARQPFAIRVETEEGYVPCGTEGYVVIHTGNAVKLVNRMEFSRNNFSQDITRGWS